MQVIGKKRKHVAYLTCTYTHNTQHTFTNKKLHTNVKHTHTQTNKQTNAFHLQPAQQVHLLQYSTLPLIQGKYANTLTHAHTCTHTHACTHTYKHKHTHIYTQKRNNTRKAHTHTYTHTHTRKLHTSPHLQRHQQLPLLQHLMLLRILSCPVAAALAASAIAVDLVS